MPNQNPYEVPATREAPRQRRTGIEAVFIAFVVFSMMLTAASCPFGILVTAYAIDAGVIPVPKGTIDPFDGEEHPRWGMIVALAGGLAASSAVATSLAVLGWKHWGPRRRNSR